MAKTHYSRPYDVESRKTAVLNYLKDHYKTTDSRKQALKQLIKDSAKLYEGARHEYQKAKYTKDLYKIELDARRAALKELKS